MWLPNKIILFFLLLFLMWKYFSSLLMNKNTSDLPDLLFERFLHKKKKNVLTSRSSHIYMFSCPFLSHFLEMCDNPLQGDLMTSQLDLMKNVERCEAGASVKGYTTENATRTRRSRVSRVAPLVLLKYRNFQTAP